MLDNHATHEEKTGGSIIVVLQKNTEDSNGRANKQQESIKENGTEKALILRINKRHLKFHGHIMRNNFLENVTPIEYIGGRRDNGRQQAT